MFKIYECQLTMENVAQVEKTQKDADASQRKTERKRGRDEFSLTYIQ